MFYYYRQHTVTQIFVINLSLLTALHNNPVVIDFHNSQRYGADIVNQMLRDHTCQLTCDSWVLVVFTFILDLVAVNTRTVLNHNKTNSDDTRKVFLRNLQHC